MQENVYVSWEIPVEAICVAIDICNEIRVKRGEPDDEWAPTFFFGIRLLCNKQEDPDAGFYRWSIE